jgi:hypothetical protein
LPGTLKATLVAFNAVKATFGASDATKVAFGANCPAHYVSG